jgi:hypothetical protein
MDYKCPLCYLFVIWTGNNKFRRGKPREMSALFMPLPAKKMFRLYMHARRRERENKTNYNCMTIEIDITIDVKNFEDDNQNKYEEENNKLEDGED